MCRGTRTQQTFVDLVLAHTGFELITEGKNRGAAIDELRVMLDLAHSSQSDYIIFWPSGIFDRDLKQWQKEQYEIMQWQAERPTHAYINLLDKNHQYKKMWPGTVDYGIRDLWYPKQRLYVGYDEWPNGLSYSGNLRAAHMLLKLMGIQ